VEIKNVKLLYISQFLSVSDADALFAVLEGMDFKKRPNPRNPKQFLKRGTMTFQDRNAATGDPKTGLYDDVEIRDLATAPPELQRLRDQLTEWIGRPVNYISINRYPDGTAGIGWHNHKEDLAINTPVLLVSVGAPRKLLVREIGKEETEGQLMAHGSMLEMPAQMNATHQHAVLPEKNAGLRYSLNCKCYPTKGETSSSL